MVTSSTPQQQHPRPRRRGAAATGGAAAAVGTGGRLATAATVAAAALALAATHHTGQAFVLASPPAAAAAPMRSGARGSGGNSGFGTALHSLGRVRGGGGSSNGHSGSSGSTTRLFFNKKPQAPQPQQRGGADATEMQERVSSAAATKGKSPTRPQQQEPSAFQPPLPFSWGSVSSKATEAAAAQQQEAAGVVPAAAAAGVGEAAPEAVMTVEDSEPLTLTSAIALVAGTTVGAGILALPAFTIKAGFLPSSLALTGAWLYMATTGLLIAETSLNLAKSHRPDGGLISMASRTIGPAGAQLAGFAYLFLHYALLVAYIAQGGEILQGGLQALVHADFPRMAAPLVFTGALGGALAFGDKKWLDKANDALVGVVVLTFLGLVALAAPRADPANLLRADFSAVVSAVPVLFVALVYHNIVPVISYRLKGNAAQIRTAIVAGSGIPLLLFLVWNAVVLGNVGPALLNAAGGVDPLALLRRGGAGDSGTLANLISVFSETAIVTSATGFVYGLKDFLKDVLFSQALAKSGTRHLSRRQDLLAYALILLPPLAVAIVAPDIFFSALDNAGAFGIACLFGIYPAAMAYITRRRNDSDSDGVEGGDDYITLVPGGTPVLAGVGLVAVLVILQKTLELLSSSA